MKRTSFFPVQIGLVSLLCLFALLGGCSSGGGDVRSLSGNEGVTARLEELSFREDGALSCVIAVTIPTETELTGDTDKERTDLCRQRFQPTLRWGGGSQPLVVVSAQLREEEGAPAEFLLETETQLTFDAPGEDTLGEIYLADFAEPFQVAMSGSA